MRSKKKEIRWVCLGCFKVTEEEPKEVCCEKRPGEPFAIERVTDFESSPWAGKRKED